MPLKVRPAEPADFGGVLKDPHIGIFSGLDKTIIEQSIADGVCQVVTYKAGEDVFAQNQNTLHLALYAVMSGLFAVKHHYASNRHETLIVAFDPPATLIGEVEQLIIGVPNELIPRGLEANSAKATITAMCQSDVLMLEGAAKSLLLSNCTVNKNLNRLLSLKLLRRSARGDAIQVYDLDEVVAALLKRLILEPHQGGIGKTERNKDTDSEWPDGWDYRLNVQILQEDWADALGKSSATISALFKRLEKRKVVACRRPGIIYVSKDFVSGRIKSKNKLDFWWW